MTKAQKNFVKGAALLGVVGLIVKVIGAFYRIPLTHVLGELGMGYYQQAYPIYAALLIISTAGLPTAISKLVSEKVAQNDYKGAHQTFLVAWRVLLFLGIFTTILMFLLAKPISMLQQSPNVWYSLMAIAPALFFVSMISAYRGYFQGLQYMAPTAFSQLLEQAGKLAFGLALAYVIFQRTGRAELGAMGAIMGVTLSEVLALVYMVIVYKKKKGELVSNIQDMEVTDISKNFKPIIKQIIMIAIPVTLGSLVNPIVQAIDSVIVSRTLQAIGYTAEQATARYGILSGYINPLINMPAVLSLALAMSLVPAISQSQAEGDEVEVKAKSSFGFKLAFLVGLPCAVGFILLAQPILNLLYSRLVGPNLTIAVGLFQLSAFGVLFLTLIQTMTGILQGLGKPFLPVISLVVGAVVKVIVSITLISQPDINIYGAAIGTIACYAIAGVMDIIFVVRRARFKFSFVNHILKPVTATLAMGVCVWLVYRLVGSHSNTLGVLAAIVIGVIVYALVLLLVKGLTKPELEMVPGGTKVERVMVKLRLWK